MKGLIPFASLTISGPGAQTTGALSTSAAQFALFSATGGSAGPASTSDDGDPAVKADAANNRMLVEAPGVYRVSVVLSGTIDAAQDIVLTLAKNGVAISDSVTRQHWTNAVKNTQDLECVINITAADNPGTIATKSDPSTSGFAGSGGFPKMMVPITILINSLAGTPTVTAEYCQFIIERIG